MTNDLDPEPLCTGPQKLSQTVATYQVRGPACVVQSEKIGAPGCIFRLSSPNCDHPLVLQCVAVRCSALQRVAVCCSVWQCVAMSSHLTAPQIE